MQLLQIHAEFKLPDDFKGSLPDALRLLADYWESDEANQRDALNNDHPTWISDKGVQIIEWEQNALERLMNKNKENGSRVVLCQYVGPYDEKTT